jgi:hypothetical protein
VIITYIFTVFPAPAFTFLFKALHLSASIFLLSPTPYLPRHTRKASAPAPSDNTMSLVDLPTEILVQVFASLDNLRDAVNLSKTCSRFDHLLNDTWNMATIFEAIAVCYWEQHI